MKTAIDKKTGLTAIANGNAAVGDHQMGLFLHILPKLWLPNEEISVNLEPMAIPEIGFNSEYLL